MQRQWLVIFCMVIGLFSVPSWALQLADKIQYIPLDDSAQPINQTATQLFGPTDQIPLEHPRYQLIFTFTIEKEPQSIQGLFIGMLAAYEMYWDEQLIGKSGQPAFHGKNEQPSNIDNIFYLPEALTTKGTHQLRLIASSNYAHGQTKSTAWAILGDYGFLSSIGLKRAIVPLVMSGAMLLLSFYMIGAYFSAGRENVSQLFCGCFCLVLFFMMITESWRGLVGYSYQWHFSRLQLVTLLSFISGLMLSLFSSFLFDIAKNIRLRLLAVQLFSVPIILLLIESHDMRSLLLLLSGALIALLAVIVAIRKKQPFAWLMFVSLMCFLSPLLLEPIDFMDRYFFVSSAALIAFMLFVQTRILRTKHEQLAISQLAQTRLELELLKKNLQPHFILNTLTAIEEWIEESPATAVEFIQALANEFRTMAKFSSRELIRLDEEVDWCKSYLKIMGFRGNLSFDLKAPLLLPAAQIPPGVLLTLVENAISHSVYKQGDILFSLDQSIDNGMNTLRFVSPITPQATKSLQTGLGSQYIFARLSEAFPEQWQFSADLVAQHWIVELSFPISLNAE